MSAGITFEEELQLQLVQARGLCIINGKLPVTSLPIVTPFSGSLPK